MKYLLVVFVLMFVGCEKESCADKFQKCAKSFFPIEMAPMPKEEQKAKEVKELTIEEKTNDAIRDTVQVSLNSYATFDRPCSEYCNCMGHENPRIYVSSDYYGSIAKLNCQCGKPKKEKRLQSNCDTKSGICEYEVDVYPIDVEVQALGSKVKDVAYPTNLNYLLDVCQAAKKKCGK